MTDESDGPEFTKDDAVRDVLRGAGIVYIGLVLQMGLAFVAQRFAAVHLSIGGFGNLVSGTALLDVGSVLAGLGLSSGFARYLPRVERAEQRPLAKYAFLLVIPASLAVAVPLVVFAEVVAARVFGEPGLAVSLRIFGAAIPFAALLNVSVGGVRGQKISRFRVYVKNILHPGARFGLIMFAVVLGAGQVGFAAGYAIPYVLAGLLSVGLFWRTLPKESNPQAARQTFPEFLRYSLPFTASNLASFVYSSIDIFLLLFIVGNRAVGVYGVAYAFAQLIGMFSTAFTFLSTPVSSQLESDDRVAEAVSVQTTIARWISIVSIGTLVPMVVFASDFLRLIYRPAFASAGPILAVLVVGFALKNVLLTHGPIIEALGRSKVTAINTIIAAVVNLGANLLLIPHYGALGAAAATTMSFAVLSVLSMLEVKYFTGVTTLSRKVLASIALAVPVTAASLPVFQAVPGTLFWIFSASGAFALIYTVAVIVIIGLTPTDVMVVRSIEDKFGISFGLFDTLLRRFS